MAYERLHWVESETPLSADNMNNIEDGIEELQAQKVDKASGKALSDNNYTSAEKTKLAGIEAGAQVNPGAATTSANGLMSAADKTKLNGIAAGAEVNQNAFSNVKVGSTTLSADSKTDTLNIGGSNHIVILPSADLDSLSIATDLENAAQNKAGLMSAADKVKLDGIDAHANNYALSRENITMSLSSNKGISAGGTALLTFSYQNLDVFTGINFQTSGGAATFDIAIVGFEITNTALYVKVKNTSSSNITLGTGTKAFAKKFS